MVAEPKRGDLGAAVNGLAGIPGLIPHELRHTAASLAIKAGADVKVVQQMLGDASAAMTLVVYAGLFSDNLDEVADRLDQAFEGLAADQVRTIGPNSAVVSFDSLAAFALVALELLVWRTPPSVTSEPTGHGWFRVS